MRFLLLFSLFSCRCSNNLANISDTSYHNKTYTTEKYPEPYFDDSTRRDYTAVVGHPAYLHCIVMSLGDREVSWIRKRDLHILTVGVQTYSTDMRFAALHSDGTDVWTLRVAYVDQNDTGGYECQVSTEPKISLPFWLTVVISKAEIMTESEMYVPIGSEINLSCTVRSPDPPSFIHWYKGDQLVDHSHRDGTSIHRKTRISRLQITGATVADSGNYTCVPGTADPVSVIVRVVCAERPEPMYSSSSTKALLVTNLKVYFTFYFVNRFLRLSNKLINMFIS